MNTRTRTNKVRMTLKRHQLLTLRGTKPEVAIKCRDGVLWITNSNDNRDHIIIASEKFSPRRKGIVLVQAMRDSRIDIEER